MRPQGVPVSSAISILLGLVQTFFLTYCWVYIAAYSPLPHWFHSLGLHGNEVQAVQIPIDFLTSVVLSLPAALVLITLRPKVIWLYLALAVLPGFIWLNYGLIGNPYFGHFLGNFALGWLPELFALPTAFWVLHFLRKPRAPNHSLKRTAVGRLR